MGNYRSRLLLYWEVSMKNIIVGLFFLIGAGAQAQKYEQAYVDSLLTEVNKAKDDWTVVDLYVQILNKYDRFNADEGLKLEQTALELATKLKSPVYLADVKNALGRLYWRKGLFKQAIAYHLDAKAVYEQVDHKEKIALTIRYIGQDYADGGNYPDALKQFYQALSAYEETGDQTNIAYIYNLLAWVYGKQGNYLEAARYNYLTLELYEKMGDQNGVAMASADVAEYYLHLGNYTEAIRYFQRSSEVYQKKGDQINLGYNYITMANALRLMKELSKAFENDEAALSIGTKIRDKNIMALAHRGKGEFYLLSKNYTDGLSHYLLSAQLFSQVNNSIEAARSFCKIGQCYQISKNFNASRKYYDSAYRIAKELKSNALLSDYYHGLEKLDSASGDWRAAYENHKNYVVNKDLVLNNADIQEMIQLQLNYEFEKREATAKAEQKEETIRQRKQFLFLGIIMVLVFILAFVLYRSQQKQRRIALALQIKTEKLEEENLEKTSILNIVSHDLRSPFNKITGLTNLIKRTDDKKEKEEYIRYIKASIDQGNYLINNLLELQSVQSDNYKLSFETVDLGKFINDYSTAAKGQLEKKEQTLHVQIPPENILIKTDSFILTRILDNLVSNASKFSEKRKAIYLSAWIENSLYCFSVRDEGPGISEADQKKMFKKFQKLSAIPTDGEGSTGLGLSITKTLIEKLNGEIKMTSRPGEGTEFIVCLPI